jgi:hypothetical protein
VGAGGRVLQANLCGRSTEVKSPDFGALGNGVWEEGVPVAWRNTRGLEDVISEGRLVLEMLAHSKSIFVFSLLPPHIINLGKELILSFNSGKGFQHSYEDGKGLRG